MNQYNKVLMSIKRLPADFYREMDENANCMLLKQYDKIKVIGQDDDRLLFLEAGVVRAYKCRENCQVHYWFKKENQFILQLHLIGNQKINWNLEMEMSTDGKLWEFSGSLVSRLLKKFPVFNYHLTHMMWKHMAMVESEGSNDGENNPSLKYDYLRQEAPDLLKRVPHAHLASFIGVSEKEFAHLLNSDLHLPISSRRHRPRKK